MSELFDRLAKMLADGATRRDTLKYLGGFLAGGFLAALAGRARADDDDQGDDDEVEAACKKYCKSCPKKPHPVHGHCISHCKRFLHKDPKGSLCGTCTSTAPFTGCVAGATCCTPTGAAAFCTNTGKDAKNCGACGNVCPAANPNCCAGKCTNTATDNNNCGTCGIVCPTGKTCKAGVCS
jgi:hypothetical protein